MAFETFTPGDAFEQTVSSGATQKNYDLSGVVDAAKTIGGDMVREQFQKEAYAIGEAVGTQVTNDAGIESSRTDLTVDKRVDGSKGALPGESIEVDFSDSPEFKRAMEDIKRLKGSGKLMPEHVSTMQQALVDRYRAKYGNFANQQIMRAYTETFQSGPYADIFRKRIAFLEADRAIKEVDKKESPKAKAVARDSAEIQSYGINPWNQDGSARESAWDEFNHAREMKEKSRLAEEALNRQQEMKDEEIDKHIKTITNDLMLPVNQILTRASELQLTHKNPKDVIQYRDEVVPAIDAAFAEAEQRLESLWGSLSTGSNSDGIRAAIDAQRKRIQSAKERIKSDDLRGMRLVKQFNDFKEVLQTAQQSKLLDASQWFLLADSHPDLMSALPKDGLILQGYKDGKMSTVRDAHRQVMDAMGANIKDVSVLFDYDLSRTTTFYEKAGNKLPINMDAGEREEYFGISVESVGGMLEESTASAADPNDKLFGMTAQTREETFFPAVATVTDTAFADGTPETAKNVLELLSHPRMRPEVQELAKTNPLKAGILGDRILAVTIKSMPAFVNHIRKIAGEDAEIVFTPETGKITVATPELDSWIATGTQGLRREGQAKKAGITERVARLNKAIQTAIEWKNEGIKLNPDDEDSVFTGQLPDNVFVESILMGNDKVRSQLTLGGPSVRDPFMSKFKVEEAKDLAKKFDGVDTNQKLAADATRLRKDIIEMGDSPNSRLKPVAHISSKATSNFNEIKDMDVDTYLKHREGFIAKPKKIKNGLGVEENVYTVGWGHQITQEELDSGKFDLNKTYTEEEMEPVFRNDRAGAVLSAQRQLQELGIDPSTAQELMVAFSSMNFQLGDGWNVDGTNPDGSTREGFTETWKFLSATNPMWKEAAEEFGHSLWALQSPKRLADVQGLILAYADRINKSEEEGNTDEQGAE